MSPFVYLLNALENAAQEKDPFKAGYPARRQEVLRYVSELEAKLSEQRPEDAGTFERGLHAAKMACMNELLVAPTKTEGDIAYDRAIHDCILAIDKLSRPQKERTPE